MWILCSFIVFGGISKHATIVVLFYPLFVFKARLLKWSERTFHTHACPVDYCLLLILCVTACLVWSCSLTKVWSCSLTKMRILRGVRLRRCSGIHLSARSVEGVHTKSRSVHVELWTLCLNGSVIGPLLAIFYTGFYNFCERFSPGIRSLSFRLVV